MSRARARVAKLERTLRGRWGDGCPGCGFRPGHICFIEVVVPPGEVPAPHTPVERCGVCGGPMRIEMLEVAR
jgi:hypothetical protein